MGEAYLQHNITLTRRTHNLQQITVKPFHFGQDLTFQTLQANQPIIDNIRLWDWQPLMDTYRQLQKFGRTTRSVMWISIGTCSMAPISR